MKIRRMLLLAMVFMSFTAVLRAEETSQNSENVKQKLDAIEQKQDAILKQLDDMKTELYAIKIRVTR